MALTPPPATPVPAAPSAPGDAPSRANPTTFRALADAFVVWQVGFRNSMSGLRDWLADYMSWASTHVVELEALQSDVATKQSTASSAASTATTKAVDAQASATAAAASRQAIDNRIYPGTYVSDPLTRPDGAARQDGDVYFTTGGVAKEYFAGSWGAININMPDLASATDTTKGAALVGYRGASVRGAVDISLRKPRKLYAKLYASASSATRLKLVELGDSLAGRKPMMVRAALDRKFGGSNLSGVNTTGAASAAGISSGGADCTSASLVSAVAESGAYSYWPTGAVLRIDAGGSSAWQLGGANPNFTTVKVYYVKEPGAGTVNLVVAGVTQATASANAPAALGILTYTQPAGQSSVSTTVTGASVRVLFVHVENAANSGVDHYASMALAGLGIDNAMSSAQGRAIFQAALVDIAPDFFTFEMDDNFGDAGPIAAAYQTLCTILNTACPTADKLIIGSTPRSSDDAGKLASSNYLRGDVASRGADWLFFDSYHLMGSYADMGAIFGADDGTHPNAAAQAYAAEVMWTFLGLNSTNMGFLARAINDRGTASKLARASKFGDASGKELWFDTDASFGINWKLYFPQSLAFYDDDTTTFAGFQISTNTSSVPNVLPSGFDFGTSGDAKKFDFTTAGGKTWARFRNTGTGTQYMPLLVQAINPVANTAAQVTTDLGGANAIGGAIINVSDGYASLGAGTYISGGAGSSDWRKVPTIKASQSTVGAAGGASALPATPTGYLKTSINATDVVIPYYAAA